MFDDIKFTMYCPMCGEEISGFQSKDGDCALSRLTPTELAAEGDLQKGVTMYTSCEKCATWTEVKFSRHENWACACGKPKVLHDKCLACHVGGLACGCRFENGRWLSLAEWRGVRTAHPEAYREGAV
ncbi:hypothetical protein [Tsukamurella tyrosinosolvens]|uniref:hypothetical protein n=1 Tax=Tsukamurella tyrosinosolvens TaxID=57704 RepID=UPI0034626136